MATEMGEGFISFLHGKRNGLIALGKSKYKGTGSFVPQSIGTMRERRCGGF
jgi:hypothetical protein